VTRDDVKKLKPDPEGLRLAVRKLGARDFIMIGDLPLDISASKEAKGKKCSFKGTKIAV
jgi:phosphoglycolate phosphatase-like HAD superfamily hydrolase